LLVDEVVPVVPIDGKVIRRDLGAEIAVNAILINVERARNIVGPLAVLVCHGAGRAAWNPRLGSMRWQQEPAPPVSLDADHAKR
jgi:hypothetical protein